MKHVVIGTAGHIDHGKTELVKALTGINPDRLKEEQERGITIDIGFAPLPLGGGLTAGFVDVPGHERFIKNMLAGVWGIDMVLLVVAADESIKPQTREHFEICSLLRVPRGIIALTKVDLVDADLRELAMLEVREFVRGSFLDEAPLVGVSARTGEGLDRLRQAITEMAEDVRPGRGGALMRLPVDRSFSMRGFGTVVTGTLVSGMLAEGDEVAIEPQGRMSRVRGIQVHSESVREARAGQRTAVNLQGLETGSVARGAVLGHPGELSATSLLDVRLSMLAGSPAPLKDMSRVRFHQGTSELLARVKLLGRPVLAPGEESFAQLRLERPGCCLPGDRFVVRRYSPPVTIGGGVVLDAFPPKHKGVSHAALTGRLERLERASPEEALMIYLETETAGMRVATLAARMGRTAGELGGVVEPAVALARVLVVGEGASATVIAAPAMEALEQTVTLTLAAYHAAHPLRPGMPREELRERALGRLASEVSRAVLERLAARGVVSERRDATVHLASHRVTLSEDDQRLQRVLMETFDREALNPPDVAEVLKEHRLDRARAERIVSLMLTEGDLVRLGDGRLYATSAIEKLKRRLWELRPERPILDIGSFKELTGTSRKNAIPLLEHLDAVKVTRRKGSDREILPPPGG
ncbi:MAG: selenocysteine-specific translation elongation factor [Candidatus Polarisedimenticolia bacterium]